MERFKRLLIAGVLLSWSVSATTWAQTTAELVKAAFDSKAKADAMARYKRIIECYKSGTLSEVSKGIKEITPAKLLLPRSAQADLAYIPRTLAGYRPPWWPNMRSPSNVTFKAALWGRAFTANFVPSDMLGGMRPVDVRNGKLVTIVSWRPHMVDNPQPAKGYLAERHKLTKAAIGEAIGWHELGHNYISYFLPLEHVFALYQNHSKLYYHLQEFYADMTSLYHSSPGGRLALFFTRLDGLEKYDDSEEHDRAAHAIGALILVDVMTYPKKWPSFHFPPDVPRWDTELNTIRYLYEHIDPNWTITEDEALRTLIQKFIATNGTKVLRSKGAVALPSRLSFMLMVSEDHTWQAKRNAWVKKQLEVIIKSGRADKTLKTRKMSRGCRIEPY